MPIQCRIHRVHQHDGLQIVDPKVVVAAVTDFFNYSQCLFLCLCFGQNTLLFLFMIILKNADGIFNQMLGFDFFAINETGIGLFGDKDGKTDKNSYNQQQNEPKTFADRNTK